MAAAAEGIVTIDQRGVVQSFNLAAEKILGYEAAEVLGADVGTLIPERFVGQHREAIRRLLESGQSASAGVAVNLPGRKKDGSEVPLALSISSVWVEGRHLFTGILRDLTEEHRLEAERKARTREHAELAQVATGVAHEIRNPLTSIKMLVQASREEGERGSLAGEDLQIINDEIRRMERCLNSFLEFARPPKPDRRRMDLAALANRTFALIEARARAQEVACSLRAPESAVIVEADWEQIQQLLLNLVLNALDAMPRGGELTVELGCLGDGHVELRVLDCGPGIPSRLLDRVFEPFITSKQTGVGLGLVLSRRIAEEHGGTLSAANRPEGGACFVLTLPRVEQGATRGQGDKVTT